MLSAAPGGSGSGVVRLQRGSERGWFGFAALLGARRLVLSLAVSTTYDGSKQRALLHTYWQLIRPGWRAESLTAAPGRWHGHRQRGAAPSCSLPVAEGQHGSHSSREITTAAPVATVVPASLCICHSLSCASHSRPVAVFPWLHAVNERGQDCDGGVVGEVM